MKASVLVHKNCILGEGAWFDWQRNELLWLDIFGQHIYVYNLQTGTNTAYPTDLPVTTIAPMKDGYILGTTDGVKVTDRNFQNWRDYITPNFDFSQYRCNDGKCGPDGRFWIGIMELNGKQGMGGLYAVDNTGYQEKLANLDVPNGIVWDEQRKKMYFTDTLNATVFAYDYVDNQVSNPVPVFKAECGMTDGMTIDENGHLWIAVWGSSCVYHVDPVSCKVLSVIECPAPQVSSVAIHNGKLYITSASSGMSKEDLEKYPESGSLFVADVPVNGIEAYRYQF